MNNRMGISIEWRVMLLFLAAIMVVGGPRAEKIAQDLAASSDVVEASQQSAQRLGRLVEWEPWRFSLWQQSGIEAFKAGDWDGAIASLEKAKLIDWLDDSGRLALGETYWQKKEVQASLAAWGTLVGQGRLSNDSYREIFQYMRLKGDFESAGRLAQAWSEGYPKDYLAAYNALILQMALLRESAPTALTRVEQLDPAKTGLLKPLRQALDRLKNSTEPGYQLVEMGRALANLNEWDLALWDFEQAKIAAPKYAEGWAFAGAARQHLKQDALNDLVIAANLAPQSAPIQALLGFYYRETGKAELALERFEAASVLEPDQPFWHIEIGNCYADLHSLQKGLAAYQAAIQIEPGNSQLWILLSQFSLAHNLEVRSIGLPAARQAVALAPDSADALDQMGQIMTVLKDEIGAERFLQQALVKNPDHLAALLHLGQYYLLHGQPGLAEYYLARAVQQSGTGEVGLIAQRLYQRFFSSH